jgi:hypothetical protein
MYAAAGNTEKPETLNDLHLHVCVCMKLADLSSRMHPLIC